MRTIIAMTQATLDGVMQAPGGPEEDPRNGFTDGRWARPLVNDGLSQPYRNITPGPPPVCQTREGLKVLGPRVENVRAALVGMPEDIGA